MLDVSGICGVAVQWYLGTREAVRVRLQATTTNHSTQVDQRGLGGFLSVEGGLGKENTLEPKWPTVLTFPALLPFAISTTCYSRMLRLLTASKLSQMLPPAATRTG